MRTIKIDKKGGNWVDLQHQRCANRNAFNDNLGKYLSQNEYESLDVALYPMPHQIVFPLKNYITMEFYASLRMMHATHTHTSQFPMPQSQKVDKGRITSSLRLIM